METAIAPILARARGTANATANGLISSIAFPHGLGAVPANVTVQARNALSAATSFVTTDATNITITFLNIPLGGALSFYWSAEA